MPKRKSPSPSSPHITRAKRVSRHEVAHHVRSRILAGMYGAGERLPTAEAMAESLGASYVTILRGLDILRDEGFVESRPRTGTFVMEHPPNLYECALVLPIPDDPEQIKAQPFYEMLLNEVLRNPQALEPWRLRPWFYEPAPGDAHKYGLSAAHMGEIANGTMAGLIFPFDPSSLRGTPALDSPGIARVTVDRITLPGVSRVSPEHGEMILGVLERLCESGCKRIAMVVPRGLLQSTELSGGEQRLRDDVSTHGLEMRPYDLLPLDLPVNDALLRRCTHALFDAPANARPDGLVLLDDHFVPAATAGIVDAGLTPPDDLVIFGYCNYPNAPPSQVPIRHFGYDPRKLLRQFVEVIDYQQKTGNVRRDPLLPVFEDDYR